MESEVLETSSDRYMIHRYLAEGGMGAIYLGKKLGVDGFEKEVVLKQLLPEFTSDPKFIDLFLREARISASLDHANIVHTIDLVAAERDFFIVMEYVRGGDLRTLMKRAKRRGKPLPPQVALHVGRGILDALGYAHARTSPDGQPLKLIHRDVSPSNILVSGAGEVKLTDFGIAKLATQQSIFYRVKGKIGYMSPEQARGETLDHRSDLYSLAVCVYEALVGQRLFVADMISTPSMIYSQPVPPPSTTRPGLPRELDALMLKALAVKPVDRFQTADEFLEAIDRVSFRNGLACSSSEVATALLEACGEVKDWHDLGDVTGPLRTGTAPLSEGEGDEDEASVPSLAGVSLTGTQLTSVLGLSRATGVSEAEEATGETRSRARARDEVSTGGWEDASTEGYHAASERMQFRIEPEHEPAPTRPAPAKSPRPARLDPPTREERPPRGGRRRDTPSPAPPAVAKSSSAPKPVPAPKPRPASVEREDERTGPFAPDDAPVPAPPPPHESTGVVPSPAPTIASESPSLRTSTEVTAPPPRRRVAPPPMSRGSRALLVIIVAIAVVLVGVLLGVALSGGVDPDADLDEPPTPHGNQRLPGNQQ